MQKAKLRNIDIKIAEIVYGHKVKSLHQTGGHCVDFMVLPKESNANEPIIVMGMVDDYSLKKYSIDTQYSDELRKLIKKKNFRISFKESFNNSWEASLWVNDEKKYLTLSEINSFPLLMSLLTLLAYDYDIEDLGFYYDLEYSDIQYGSLKVYEPKETYFIPDIHGRVDLLEILWDKLKVNLDTDDHVIFLGDYFGEHQNLKTLIYLQKIKNEFKNVFFIEGNHDHSFINFLRYGAKNFLNKKTILPEILEFGYPSSRPENFERFLKDYNIDFLDKMIPYYETKEFILTHAPLSEEMFMDISSTIEFPLDHLSPVDILYNFTEPKYEMDGIPSIKKWVICGHQNNYGDRKTPSIYPKTKRIYMDCGCGYENDYLPALRFSDKKIF